MSLVNEYRPIMEEAGYVVIPFPYNIGLQMKDYVMNYLVKHGRHIVEGGDAYEEAFNKGQRVFPDYIGKNAAEAMKANLIIKSLLNYNQIDLNRLCQYELDRNPQLKKDQYHVYWRFVRPNKVQDIGRPHRDSQFNALDTDRDTGIEGTSWKLWVPIAGCTLENSLRVIAGSHRMDVPIKYLDTQYGPKPDIDQEWLNSQKFVCPFDHYHLKNWTAVIFHEDLVHMGPLNTSDSFRISAEITIYVN